MRVTVVPALLVLVGCAETPPPRAAAPRSIATDAQRAPVTESVTETAPPPREPPPNRCLPQGLPKPAPAEETRDGHTCQDHRRREPALARELSRRYKPSVKGSTVDVAFGCDPLTSRVEQVVFERGSGHGGSFVLWRLRRNEHDSSVFDVAGFAFDSGYFRPKDFHEHTIARGKIPSAALTKALDEALPAMTAVIRELEPPPVPNALRGRSFFSSSADFHAFVSVRDAGEHVLERSYTGYPGSDAQRQYLGVQLAQQTLDPLVDKLAFEPGTASDEEKAFFVSHYLAAQPRLHREFAWWVRERAMRLAGYMGTPALVPTLIDEMKGELATLGDKPSESGVPERHLEDAAGALARLTGWDARLDENGQKRPIVEVAKDYVAECGRALGK